MCVSCMAYAYACVYSENQASLSKKKLWHRVDNVTNNTDLESNRLISVKLPLLNMLTAKLQAFFFFNFK